MGGAGHRHARRRAAHGAVLRGDAAARRDAGRVHPDAAVHAAPEGQPGGVDGLAQRRRSLRRPGRVQVPEAEADLRAAAGRRPHQPGSGDLAADHAVEPAGLAGDPGHAAGDPGRGVAALRARALPEGRGRQDPGAEARHRRAPERDRDGGDAGRGDRSPVRQAGLRRSAAAARPDAGAAASPATSAPPRRSSVRGRRATPTARRSPPRRWPTTSAPSPPSAKGTGRSTARRSRSSARC